MLFTGPNFKTIGGRFAPVTSGPNTLRLLIVGTALDGPKNQPFKIADTQTFSKLFGPARFSNGYKNPVNSLEDGKFSGASLPLAVHQAIQAGCQDIWVMRATGSYASAPSAFNGMLNIRSIYPGLLYNNVYLTVSTSAAGTNAYGLSVTVSQPSNKGGNFTTTYSSGFTIGEVIDDLNNHRLNTTFVIARDTYPSFLANSCSGLGWGVSTSGTATLANGTNGTNARGDDYVTSLNGYATELTATDTGTFDTLLGMRFPFNVAVLTGIHLDDQVSDASPTDTSISTDFAVWLDNMSIQSMPCVGVMKLRPVGISDPANYISYITGSLQTTTYGYWNQTLRWLQAGPFLYNGYRRYDQDGNVVDMGARLQVTAGPDVIYTHPEIGRYTDNFGVSYAAMLTTVPPERSPIFQPIAGISGYGMRIPGKYADQLLSGVGFSASSDLSGKGAYVVLVPSPRLPGNPLVVYEDVTCAFRDDYFSKLQLMQLCNAIHASLSEVCSPYIGGPSSPAVLASMKGQVKNVLEGYTQSNALRGSEGTGYNYDVTMEGTDQLLGIVRVYVNIWPATAIRRIQFTVQVRQAN